MQKKYLMTPGPTPVPSEVLLAQARPMIHHRTPDFSAALMEAVEGLKYVFQTTNDVLIFGCCGTGAMESAFANCFCAGDTVIVARNGKFGDRMVKIAKAYGLEVIDLKYEWTETVKVADVADALAQNPGVRGVVVVQSETSSGVLNDVEAIGKLVAGHGGCVFIVDSITGIGAVPCMTDAWNLDVVMTGSQKGLMLPPGLAAVSVSPKAWKAYERSTLPKFYFDWGPYKKNLANETTPFTPPVSLIIGLAEATRRGCEALGMKLFAPPEGRGSAVTPVWVPEGVDGKAIVKIMKNKYGVTIAGGQDDYVGRIFRVGHLGYFGEFDIITTLAALEMTLAELGYDFERGSGIKAAEAVFMGE